MYLWLKDRGPLFEVPGLQGIISHFRDGEMIPKESGKVLYKGGPVPLEVWVQRVW